MGDQRRTKVISIPISLSKDHQDQLHNDAEAEVKSEDKRGKSTSSLSPKSSPSHSPLPIDSAHSKLYRFLDYKDTETNQLIKNPDGSKKYSHSEKHETYFSSNMGTPYKMLPTAAVVPITLKRSAPAQAQYLQKFPLNRYYDSPTQRLQPQPNRGLSLRKVLLHRSLNVEHLGIGEFQKLNLDPNDQLYLPNVKSISWHIDLPYCTRSQGHDHEHDLEEMDDVTYHQKRQSLYKILLATPNLQLIRDFNFDTDWDLVLATGRVYAVQDLCLLDTVNMDHLVEFLEARPHIQSLQLVSTTADVYPEEARRLAWLINQLIRSTANTLHLLDLTQFCSKIDFKISCPLPKLHQLTLGSIPGFHEDPARCLPRGIWLDEIFSHVKILDVSRFECEENSNWDLYFPLKDVQHPDNFLGSLASVKVLVVSDEMTIHFMENLYKLICPNFIKLIVQTQILGQNFEKTHHQHNASSLVLMLAKIFRFWRHLQFLEIRVSEFPSNEAAFSLDSAFTGLTEETCRRLRIYGGDVSLKQLFRGGKYEMEREGVRPSIANLQKLRYLDIVLDHSCLEKWATHAHDYPVHILSFVAGRFGFSLVPSLKVSIFFDQKCPWGKALLKKLEEECLDRYVNLRQKHDCCCSNRGELVSSHHQGSPSTEMEKLKSVRFNR